MPKGTVVLHLVGLQGESAWLARNKIVASVPTDRPIGRSRDKIAERLKIPSLAGYEMWTVAGDAKQWDGHHPLALKDKVHETDTPEQHGLLKNGSFLFVCPAGSGTGGAQPPAAQPAPQPAKAPPPPPAPPIPVSTKAPAPPAPPAPPSPTKVPPPPPP
eukprot:Sspe_Gene.90129::Locus_61754_Transcript_1_1_Confidence_1.000_Length_519::g.90129::m.90129